MCVSVYLHLRVHVYLIVWQSEEATGLINSSPAAPCVSASERSHRTMGLFLWCNWSIRQNEGRACCSACASSIMHKRCTDRKLLVKHDTCKSPALSLAWHCSARGRYVVITDSGGLLTLLLMQSSPFGTVWSDRVLLWEWTERTRKCMKWYSEFHAGQTVNG